MDISRISAALADSPESADLPVERWRPTHCGEMDLVIRSDGSWIHEGTPIGRPSLVRLLSRVLRLDPEGYVLVTPVEKIAIEVEDVPFLITEIDREGDVLIGRTNVGDSVRIGPAHPLALSHPAGDKETLLPYVLIRGELWARLGRAAYYRLIDEESWEEAGCHYISSDGQDFLLGKHS